MKFVRLFLFLILGMLAICMTGFGQDGPPPDRPDGDHAEGRRPDLFAELGLTPEQFQRIRRMNQERKPAMMQAQRRMREANRALDMAIYADVVSDTEFQARLTEFRNAQSELARLRFESELAVRKILTPEQLVRFRELRRKFAEEREAKRPNRRFRRDGDRPPPPDGPAPGHPDDN